MISSIAVVLCSVVFCVLLLLLNTIGEVNRTILLLNHRLFIHALLLCLLSILLLLD